jgi:hypothetical protein
VFARRTGKGSSIFVEDIATGKAKQILKDADDPSVSRK